MIFVECLVELVLDPIVEIDDIERVKLTVCPAAAVWSAM